jgi:hypothetical protein
MQAGARDCPDFITARPGDSKAHSLTKAAGNSQQGAHPAGNTLGHAVFFPWPLSLPPGPLARTLLVDDNSAAFLLHPSNGVPCKPWTGLDAADDHLPAVILPLLQSLALFQDVR